MPDATPLNSPQLLLFPQLRKRAVYVARFLAKVNCADLTDPEQCWLWTGAQRNKLGYGAFWYEGKTEYAHRVAIVLFKPGYKRKGLPAGLIGMHKCDTPRCVSPHHQTPGTHSENQHYRYRSYGPTYGGAARALLPVAA